MTETIRKLGFSYFSGSEYMINKQMESWLPVLSRLGASYVVFKSGFDCGLPEDAFLLAEENNLEPIVHFTSELPSVRKFNDVAVLLDIYAKRGVKSIILGDKPNTKGAWTDDGWHYENLVDHFLDRFIPLSNYAVQAGLYPFLPPMQPGGDYWDMAFIELVMKGLKRRKLDAILEKLALSGYGYTFNHHLSWGKGGPECWSASKPYLTPDGQEDQLGFHNFEWVQSQAYKIIGRQLSVLILDSGNSGLNAKTDDSEMVLENIQRILQACRDEIPKTDEELKNYPVLEDSVAGCTFNLETIAEALDGDLTIDVLEQVFRSRLAGNEKSFSPEYKQKKIHHYLLLPCHTSGVSDAVLNKVRPVIRKYQPTIGFSPDEARMAQKVTIFPDPTLFTDEFINQLRSAGCMVEILPDSGIDIATSLQ
jgi:hypothetical protein